MRKRPQVNDSVIIIGAGVFGLSTALELSRQGFNVSVLDRHLPPVPDGSSVDISRVIRPDYADPYYAKLGLEAMKGWETTYSSFFHRSGLLCATQDLTHPYLEGSKENLRRLGMRVDSLEGNETRQRYPAINGDLSSTRGYCNPACGWADAEGSIKYLAQQCSREGVSFTSGPRGTAISLLCNDRKIVGVQTKRQIPLYADHVILATGAWTPYLLNMSQVSVSDTQPVGFMQLTSAEAEEMKGCPVMINMSTGWFAFPPTPGTNILKMARHGYGYEVPRHSGNQIDNVSVPHLSKDNSLSNFIPDDADKALRDGLALFLPKFKDKPFIRKRLCWYSDTPHGDFIVDYHADYDNLFIAGGGSGHAFKFLPVLGHYVVKAFRLSASQEQMTKWAWKPQSEPISKGDGSRGGPPRRNLSKEELAHL